MRKFLLLAAASAATLGFASPAAAAVCIGTSVNGGAIVNQGCDNVGAGSASYTAITGGYSYNVGGTGFPLLSMPNLLTQSINVQSVGGANAVIDVFVTQTGLTSLNSGLLSTFTSNTVSGLTADITSYFSSTNALWTGTQLQDNLFTTTGVFSGSNPLNVTGPWSETVRYRLNFTGGNGSNFNGTANLTAVPEPATWGMMLLGFLGVGMVMRRRRHPALAQLA